jgi:hypothetical protein
MLLVARHTQNLERYFCGFDSLVSSCTLMLADLFLGGGEMRFMRREIQYFITNMTRLKIMLMWWILICLECGGKDQNEMWQQWQWLQLGWVFMHCDNVTCSVHVCYDCRQCNVCYSGFNCSIEYQHVCTVSVTVGPTDIYSISMCV